MQGGAPDRPRLAPSATGAAWRQTTPGAARRRVMIGGKDECLDTVERYTAAGVTHFIFMTFAPFFPGEIQAFAEEVVPAVRGH
jgi:alkanesulfonate monooxygenase SsuD/methylene tetrahydromethanopterin reductase-like flavin-dependent oxidoreductase (luciferase family)